MKTFFFSRHIREKVLLTALLALVGIVWLGRVARSGHTFWTEWRANAARGRTPKLPEFDEDEAVWRWGEKTDATPGAQPGE